MFVIGLIWSVFYLISRLTGGARRQLLLQKNPVQAYTICHDMLAGMVERAYYLFQAFAEQKYPVGKWDRYSVSPNGLLILPTGVTTPGLLAPIDWAHILGVGVEMRPLYSYTGATDTKWSKMARINIGYQFNLLIVPTQGETITITLPIHNSESALIFGAHTLAYARYYERRTTMVGFDKGLTRPIVHFSMF